MPKPHAHALFCSLPSEIQAWLVDQAFEYRCRQPGSELAGVFETWILAMKIAGFRTPLHASEERRRAEFRKRARHYQRAAAILVEFWLESIQADWTLVPSATIEAAKALTDATWEDETAVTLARPLSEGNPFESETTARLFLLCVGRSLVKLEHAAGSAGASDSVDEADPSGADDGTPPAETDVGDDPTSTPPLDPTWDAIVDDLSRIPPESPFWDGAERMLQRLGALASEKLAAREGVKKLDESLSRLRTRNDRLALFELPSETWSPEDWPLEEAHAVAASLDELSGFVGEHEELDRRHFTAPIAERESLRLRMQELEKSVVDLYGRLAAKRRVPAPSHPDTAGPAAVTDGAATPTDGDSSDVEDDPASSDVPEQPSAEIESTAIESAEFESAQAESTQAESTQAESTQAESTQTEQPQIEVTQEESAQDDATPIESPPPAPPPVDEAPTEVSAESRWKERLWQYVADDDVSGAYWLAWCLQRRNVPDSPDPLLLEAVFGAQSIIDVPRRGAELGEIALTYSFPGGDFPGDDAPTEIQLLGVAAALVPSLTAPAAGLQDWLRTSVPALRPLLEAVRTFAHQGHPLRACDLDVVRGIEKRNSEVIAAAQDLRNWLDTAPHWTTPFQRGTQLWRLILDGELKPFLDIAANDQRHLVAQVNRQTRVWSERRHQDDRVDALDKRIRSQSASPLVGSARRALYEWIADGVAHARAWADLVAHHHTLSSGQNGLQAHIERFVTTVNSARPAAETALAALADDLSDKPRAAAAKAVVRSLKELRRLWSRGECDGGDDWLRGRVPVEPPPPGSPSDRPALQRVLRRRLLTIPHLDVTDGDPPVAASEDELAQALCDHPATRDRAEALYAMLERRDFRFVPELLGGVADPDEQKRLESAVASSRAEARDTLEKEARHTREAVEKALLDGLIGDERAGYDELLVALSDEGIDDFRTCLLQLEEIRRQLDAMRARRIEEQKERWSSLRAGAPQSLSADLRRVGERLSRCFEAQDTRVADELLHQLDRSIHEGRPLPQSLASPEAFTDDTSPLVDFQNAEGLLRRVSEEGLAGLARSLRSGEPCPLPWLNDLPEEQRANVLAVVEAWRALRGSRGLIDVYTHVDTVLRHLGLTPTQATAEARPADTANVQRGPDLAYLRLDRRGRSPLPFFGSQLESHPCSVLVVRERPDMDAAIAWVQERHTGSEPLLVLYLDRLSPAQRTTLHRLSRKDGLTVAVLDELLLLWLLSPPAPSSTSSTSSIAPTASATPPDRDKRLEAFLACALPYTSANPYTPFQRGGIPPEMFVGRSEPLRLLSDPSGSCIVYGGRQLGKSALLRQIARREHAPSQKRYAVVVDIDKAGDANSSIPAGAMWEALRDKLKEHGIFSPQIVSDRPEAIVKNLRHWLQDDPARRLLLLLDEADNFLDADARESFPNVTLFRSLMSDFSRRFKVVLAGLHSVQRFQGIPNQPLAHFGQAVQIGPLEPDAARKLVEEPLRRVGFRFADPGSVLRILSYTNYHPGLLQHFCHKLLEYLGWRAVGKEAPYEVTDDDVEAVYRRQDVRDHIRDRFDLTLRLDRRYQAIAWILVVQQRQPGSAFGETYEPMQLLEEARSWWPLGFQDFELERFCGLLDEMVGLGVLMRRSDGRYRLRSPNVIQLLGTLDTIEGRLLELSNTTPSPPFVADSHRPELHAGGPSPLTHDQARRLDAQRFGVVLVFGSQALGIDRVPPALDDLARRRRTGGAPRTATELPADLRPGELSHRLMPLLAAPGADDGPTYVWQRVRTPSAELVKEALRFCEIQRKRRSWLRLVLIFDPPATAQWLSLPRVAELEQRADAILSLRRYDGIGLHQLLKAHTPSDTLLRRAMDATRGWPCLLQWPSHLPWPSLLESVPNAAEGEVDEALSAVEAGLSAPDSELRRRFRDALLPGLLDRARAVLLTVGFFGEMSESDLSPSLVEGAPDMSADELKRHIELLLRTQLIERHEGRYQADPVALRVME